jgi:hypothetical protein
MASARDDDRSALTAKALRAALASELSATDAGELAVRLRDQVGDDALRAGKAAIVEGAVVGWAIEAEAERPPSVVAQAGPVYRQRLRRLGETNVYAGRSNCSGPIPIAASGRASRRGGCSPSRAGGARSSPARSATGRSTSRRSTTPRARRAS